MVRMVVCAAAASERHYVTPVPLHSAFSIATSAFPAPPRIPGSDRRADRSWRVCAEVVAAGRAEVVRFAVATPAMTHEGHEGQWET